MNLLKKDKRLWDKDILNKPLLFELLEKYDSELFKLLLSDKETNSFPELVNPLALRENQYRIAFFSNTARERVMTMNHENSYFTRLDSDRERISAI